MHIHTDERIWVCVCGKFALLWERKTNLCQRERGGGEEGKIRVGGEGKRGTDVFQGVEEWDNENCMVVD